MAGLTRRAWFKVHSWIGLTCGLLLFVVCWSGTVAVFSHEIDWLLNKDIRAPAAADPMKWQAIEDAVRFRYPDWRIVSISAPPQDGFAAEVLAEPEAGKTYRIYVDPTTAAIAGHTSYFNVQRFFRSFHMALFDRGDIKLLGVPLGYLVVALLAFPLLGSLVASLLFYKRWWRGFFQLRIGHGAKAFWSSAHKLVGVWSLWFILAIGVTGVWYWVEWYVPYTDTAAARTVPARSPLPLDMLIAKAAAAYPDLQPTGISSWDDGPVIWVEGRDGSFLVRDRTAGVTIDRYTGEVLELRKPGALNALDRWTETADPIHFGTWGGLWSKALYFLFGLGLSGLTLTGAYLQAKRQQRSGVTVARAPVLAAYVATLAFVVSAVINGYREISDYGVAGNWPEVATPIAGFLLAWCASTVAALSIWMWKLR